MSMRGLPFVTDKRGTTEKIMELSERYSLAVDPEAMVWTLSIGERQRVEILKMLYRGTKVLILDEPTSVLTPQEVRVFFAALRRMTEAGHGIVIISHKIEEILSIASRMTILRKGERVATVEAKDTTRETLARMMPYLMTLGVLVFISVRSKSGILLGAPASLGTPFRREERE